MLVLSVAIKNGEIYLNDGETRIVIMGINGSKVKVGIDAPRDVTVERDAVYAERTGLPVNQPAENFNR